jgi:hypothetical protein
MNEYRGRAFRFHQDVWDVVLRWDADGVRQRKRVLESPYLPMLEITEGEAGGELLECFACHGFREGVSDELVEFDRPDGGTDLVPCDVCAACRADLSS